MKLTKKQIRLSPLHPSTLVLLEPQSGIYSPLIVNRENILIDGYRRFHMIPEDEVEVSRIETHHIFETALALNLRTRTWDENDCFFWKRWALDLGIQNPELPVTKPSPELYGAPENLLGLLANRLLTVRQAQLLLQAPARHRKFLQAFLTETILLNQNETASFIDMASDLAKLQKCATLSELFAAQPFAAICGNSKMERKQKGEAVLKAMRSLRYPYYQKLSEDFSSNWQLFNFEGVQVNKSLLVERGVLEITLSATSFEDMKAKIGQLHASLTSPVWSKIWEK